MAPAQWVSQDIKGNVQITKQSEEEREGSGLVCSWWGSGARAGSGRSAAARGSGAGRGLARTRVARSARCRSSRRGTQGWAAGSIQGLQRVSWIPGLGHT